MQKQYYHNSMKTISVLQILAVYITEGVDTTQPEELYLIPINPANGIISSAGSSAAGFGPEQAVDYELPNSRRTYWNPQVLPRLSPNYFIVFDFKTIYLVTKLHIINVGDNVHDVTAFKLESSSNSRNWIEVARFFCQAGTNSKQKFGGFISMDRYWKFTITNTISGLQPWLVEVGFYGTRLDFEAASKDEMNISHSTEVQEIRSGIERSLQKFGYKYGNSQSSNTFMNPRERGRSLKEPTFKYKHNNSRTTPTDVALDDVIDVKGELINDTMTVMNSGERSTPLKEPTFKYKHTINRIPTSGAPHNDVNVMDTTERSRSIKELPSNYKHISRENSTLIPLGDVLSDVIDDNTNMMEPKEINRPSDEHKFKYKHNISRQNPTDFSFSEIDDEFDEDVGGAILLTSTERVPMAGTTKLISHMHVTSLDTNIDSFEDFFQLIGISKEKDTDYEKLSSNVIQVEKGPPSTKYMTWLYLTMGLVLLGITLVAMGCFILQLIKRQNKLLASAIELNKRSIACRKPKRPERNSNQCKTAYDQCGELRREHRDLDLPVTPV